MALFGLGKKKPAESEAAPEKKKEEVKAPEKAPAKSVLGKSDGSLFHMLRNPRITEKATSQSEIGVYTFDVSEDATKKSVAQAVASVYNVTPRLVRIVPVPKKARRSMRTGHRGVSGGGKKAYVYLRKGETITIT